MAASRLAAQLEEATAGLQAEVGALEGALCSCGLQGWLDIATLAHATCRGCPGPYSLASPHLASPPPSSARCALPSSGQPPCLNLRQVSAAVAKERATAASQVHDPHVPSPHALSSCPCPLPYVLHNPLLRAVDCRRPKSGAGSKGPDRGPMRPLPMRPLPMRPLAHATPCPCDCTSLPAPESGCLSLLCHA